MKLQRSTPEAQGVASAGILGFVEAVEAAGLGLHSLMLLRHGHVIAEGWWAPYRPELPHVLYSLSKSFASTAAGLAVHEGHFSLDDRVIDFFPEDLPEIVSENLAAMRVRDLLAMATGHLEDATGATVTAPEGNWPRAFLALPVEKAPGTHFVYNSAATYMVAAIVEKTTGEGLLRYLTPRLLEPLGIVGATWDTCPRGVAVGGWGLHVRTEDIAQFGQLYLEKGRDLLPPGWVDEATRSHIANGDNPDNDWNQGYGFQFWRCRHGAYRGDGAFGQYCIVFPEQDAVLAITSGTDDMQGILNQVWAHLLPALSGEGGVAIDLPERLANLTLPQPTGAASSPVATSVSGRTFRFPQNELGLESLTAVFDEQSTQLTLTDARGTHTVRTGESTTTFALDHLTWRSEHPVVGVGAWTDPQTYTLKLSYIETPYTPTLTLRFAEDTVTVEVRGKMGFGPSERPVVVGQ